MNLSNFEEAAKGLNSSLGLNGDKDVEVNMTFRLADAVKLAKNISYGEGIYVSEDTIQSMGGFKFKCNNVSFKITVY